MAVMTENRPELKLGWPAFRLAELRALLKQYCDPTVYAELKTDGLNKDSLVSLMDGLVAQGKLESAGEIIGRERGEANLPPSVKALKADNDAMKEQIAALTAAVTELSAKRQPGRPRLTDD